MRIRKILRLLCLLLVSSIILLSPRYAMPSPGTFVSHLDRELEISPINYNFAVNNNVIHFNEIAYYYNSSLLHNLFISLNEEEQLAREVYTSHNATLWLEYYNSSIEPKIDKYLLVVANDYEHSINSSYSLATSNYSFSQIGNNEYKLVAYFNLVYKGVESLCAIKVVLVLNSSAMNICVIDGLSLLHVVPFTPIKISANLTKLIEEKIDNGIRWQDVMIKPVLMKIGNSLVYVLQVKAYYQQDGGAPLYLTAYFYPYNVSLISEKVTPRTYQHVTGEVTPLSHNSSAVVSVYNLFILFVAVVFTLLVVYYKKSARVK